MSLHADGWVFVDFLFLETKHLQILIIFVDERSKITYLKDDMEFSRYRFEVVPSAFTVHHPHPPSFEISRYRGSALYRKCMRILRNQFARDLHFQKLAQAAVAKPWDVCCCPNVKVPNDVLIPMISFVSHLVKLFARVYSAIVIVYCGFVAKCDRSFKDRVIKLFIDRSHTG